ncbi:agmatine deiminase family protein [Bacteroides propionicifaciens]|jgi:agmatine deiminase|uniref:agmatine deiminase family protein n=1 Tax=Bacteroides propionicifaciens TaxID=392838 RepID=UPI0003787338|nr:agmatine deiminase family protein [Bacteroides propionicifaciens]
MIYDKDTNIVHLSPWLEDCFPIFYKRFTSLLGEHVISYKILPHTNDLWCRDYMPIQIEENTFVQYQYMPDYLLRKESNVKYLTDSRKVCEALGYKCKRTNIVLDGGNIVKVGNCVIMTEKVFCENPNYKRDELISELEELLKLEIVLIPWDKKEIYGHSDGIIKGVNNDTILMTNYYDYDKIIANAIEHRLQKKFTVLKLQYNVTKPDKRNWCYINYLEVGNTIILPALGIEEDILAFNQIKAIFPMKKVLQILAPEIIAKGGALNCITWNCKINLES